MPRRLRIPVSVVMGGVAVFFSLLVHAASPVRILSDEFKELGFYVFKEREVNNQSGERVVIDALLFADGRDGALSEGDETLRAPSFSLRLPSNSASARVCLDLASRTASFRRIALVEVAGGTDMVNAHIDPVDAGEIGDGGAVMVAFSTDDDSTNPLEACLLQNDWIFPARNTSMDDGNGNPILQLRLNAGNGTSTVVQVDGFNVAIGPSVKCIRDEGKNGLFDRLCRIQISDAEKGIARIKTRIQQRNGIPSERIFNVVVGETQQ